jgi:glycosylphosphatidylinositol transamidase (GPIT) subunit GPI8
MYEVVKQMGIPDSQILLFLPDEYACNPRNTHPATIFDNDRHTSQLYARDIEVDYRGTEVSVESFLRLLTGRHHVGTTSSPFSTTTTTPRSKRLLTNRDSNVLIYLAGHGGNNFLKFQDAEELNSKDIGDSLAQMHRQNRYKSVLLMVDTCQASTLFTQLNPVDTPNVVTVGSSKIEESSYSVSCDSVHAFASCMSSRGEQRSGNLMIRRYDSLPLSLCDLRRQAINYPYPESDPPRSRFALHSLRRDSLCDTPLTLILCPCCIYFVCTVFE